MEFLTINDVRRIAGSLNYVESCYTKPYNVVTFTKQTLEQDPRFVLINVDIWLTTGDIGVYIPHHRQKAWRLFHLAALVSEESTRTVLACPWSDTSFSYHLGEVIAHPKLNLPQPTTIANALERQLVLIDRELADLQRERAELFKYWRGLQQDNDRANDSRDARDARLLERVKDRSDQPSSAENLLTSLASAPNKATSLVENMRGFQPFPTTRQEISSAVSSGHGNHGSLVSNGAGIMPRIPDKIAAVEAEVRLTSATETTVRNTGDRARGNKGVWSLFYPDAQDKFAKAWAAKSVAHVALSKGFVVTYDDGSVVWHHVSSLLESKLHQQSVPTGNAPIPPTSSRSNSTNVRIRYIVLGDEGNFYVKFDNGRMEWCGQDSFGSALRRGVSENHLLVEKVAFAHDGGWLIIWSDRTFEAENIPDTLEQRLGGTRVDDSIRLVGQAAGIKDITLGPAGEWFLIYRDHSVQADNLPDGLFNCLSQIREKNGRVRSIAFGENRSWFVRYWDGSQ